jgi:hypothetical protein
LSAQQPAVVKSVTRRRSLLNTTVGAAMAVLAAVAALISAGVASAAPIGGLTAGSATATSLQRPGGPITNPVVGTGSASTPLEVFPAGGKGSGTKATCDYWNGELNGDELAIDNAWNNGNDNDAEHGLDGFYAANEKFDQDYDSALDAGCVVIDT